jgi:hypothetical protein
VDSDVSWNGEPDELGNQAEGSLWRQLAIGPPRRTGVIRQLMFTPDNPAAFKEALDEALAARAS